MNYGEELEFHTINNGGRGRREERERGGRRRLYIIESRHTNWCDQSLGRVKVSGMTQSDVAPLTCVQGPAWHLVVLRRMT
jgi:hypothetical protein